MFQIIQLFVTSLQLIYLISNYFLMQATPERLKTINVFSQLESTFIEKLALGSKIQSYQSGEIVIHEGDRLMPKFYAILEGELSAQKISREGKETILRQLPSGEMFAAPALFGNRIAPATLIALQDTKIVTIKKDTLLEVIQSDSDIALQILSCLNQRLQVMHQTIHGLISERAIIRLVRLIIYTAKRYGFEKTNEGVCLNHKLPYQQMARTIGITYEECVRLMKKDLNTAVIYRRGGSITIKSLANLEEFLSQMD